MGKLNSFKDLLVWQKATELSVMTYNLTKKFPKSEIYGLSSQMRRAAISINSNIAEGFKRIHQKEKIQFYHIAHGSTAELESQVETAYLLGFFKNEEREKIIELLEEVSRFVYSLIVSTQSKSYT